ncbi:MAG TPA: DUF1587 domain-containing protein, partial [Pirellulaceae bacterium]|nr:DUF1587 domain-containing protein [Pirellulaceae bacterium]
TGVKSLSPAAEFPVDGAAGEGFTNTGNALAMSPALLTKYLDAAKDVSQHMVLLPDGVRFSSSTTRRDWTEEVLADIRRLYAVYSDSQGGTQVNLQGIVFDTNGGGRLPVERYLAATLAERDALAKGTKTIDTVARERSLSPKYLGLLWNELTKPADASKPGPATPPSMLLDALRTRWKTAQPSDASALAAEVARWQIALWKFTSVGHIGKVGGPKAWMEPVNPLVASQELRMKLPAAADGKDVVLYLSAGDAGDGNPNDFALWGRPRLVAPGRPDILLRDVAAVTRELETRRRVILSSVAKCLDAAAEASGQTGEVALAPLAAKHGVDPDALAGWLQYLGIGVASGPAKVGAPITRQMQSGAGYDFIKGWVGDDALSVVANSSDQTVRIPGTMVPHSVAVHPAPTIQVVIGWRAPVAGKFRVGGFVQHAHHDCGNGVAWTVEIRRGNTRQRLAAGNAQGPPRATIGPLENIALNAGDFVTLVINPRDRNHSCDLTQIDLTFDDGQRKWGLASDVSPQILAGNPHADSHGNANVWHFNSEPDSGS